MFQEEFEDTKGAIRIRISKKNRQHNGQKKKYKRTSLQRSTKHPYKTKDRVTRIPLKTGCELRCCVSCSLEHTIRKFNVSVNDSIIKRYSLVGKVFLQPKFKSFCCIVTILAISFKSSA